MTALNLILALLAVAALAAVMLLGVRAGNQPHYAQLPAEEPEHEGELELAA
jgi:hypothetical protein